MQATTITQAIAREQSRDRIAAALTTHASDSDDVVIRLARPDDVVIRLARPDDRGALRRLAQLDGRGRGWEPGTAPLLVAESEGTLVAALPLRGGAAVADPFRPTADLVNLLEARARQLADAGRGREAGGLVTALVHGLARQFPTLRAH